MPVQLSDHRPVIAQLVLPCSHVRSSSETPYVFEVAFQKLVLSLSCLPPTANGAPPGKPFIRIYLSCGSLPQHAPADHAKFAQINDGYDKIDATNPDDQLFLASNQATSRQSTSGSDVPPEHEITLGSGSSSVSPHLLADCGRMTSAPPMVISVLVVVCLYINHPSGCCYTCKTRDAHESEALWDAHFSCRHRLKACIRSAPSSSGQGQCNFSELFVPIFYNLNQVDSLRKGSGHVFVGQVSWKEEGSIPVITSAEVSTSQFTNS
jgi:hypothetical protein